MALNLVSRNTYESLLGIIFCVSIKMEYHIQSCADIPSNWTFVKSVNVQEWIRVFKLALREYADLLFYGLASAINRW